MAILSCCWAASSARGTIEVEVIGLATTLLALGVQQVLAPLVPIADHAAGVIGADIATAVAAGLDLRQALPKTLEAVRDPEPTNAHPLPPGLIEICPHDPADFATARGE